MKEEKQTSLQVFSTCPSRYYQDEAKGIVTIADAIRKGGLTLGDLSRTREHDIHALLVSKIGESLEYYGIDKNSAKNSSVALVVRSLIGKYFYFTIQDIHVLFKKAFEGCYERRFYGNQCDMSVIASWFSEYDTMRSRVCESLPTEYIEPDMTGCITREQYILSLKQDAANGNDEAKSMLDNALESEDILREMLYSGGGIKYNKKE